MNHTSSLNRSAYPPLVSWLAAAAVLDWLITRTITRAGVFIPKSEGWIAIFKGLTWAGLFASTLAALLSLAVLGWIVWKGGCSASGKGRFFACTFAALTMIMALLSLLSVVVPPAGGIALAGGIVRIAVVLLLIWKGRKQSSVVIPGLAVGLGSVYQLLPVWYQTAGLPGPPAAGEVLFNLGETFVVLGALSLWMALGREFDGLAIGLGSIPALLFTGMFLRVPSMAGIFAIWSLGVTLFLPWPVYALAAWAAGAVSIHLWRKRRGELAAVLLLVAGGYAPQLSTQFFFSVIALWMLAAAAHQEPEGVKAVGQPFATHSPDRAGSSF